MRRPDDREPGEGNRWQDADGDGVGARGYLRRVFGDGENILTWAIPLYRLWGIRVRMHVVFALLIVLQMAWSLTPTAPGPAFVALSMASLFLLVLLHEYGHCFACRWIGGEAREILMWPLGGLAFVQPPEGWRASLITTVGGPAVNLLLFPILAFPLIVLFGWPTAIFWPWDPLPAAVGVQVEGSTAGTYLALALFWLHYANTLLLLFNVLVPMYPMDGGRILHALLWRRMGQTPATSLAVKIGIGAAVVLALIAITINNVTLLCIALFGGFTCLAERRRLAMIEPEAPWAASARNEFEADGGSAGASERRSRAKESQEARARQDQAELDRLLDKIARSGMGSLSGREKRWLDRASRARRGE